MKILTEKEREEITDLVKEAFSSYYGFDDYWDRLAEFERMVGY